MRNLFNTLHGAKSSNVRRNPFDTANRLQLAVLVLNMKRCLPHDSVVLGQLCQSEGVRGNLFNTLHGAKNNNGRRNPFNTANRLQLAVLVLNMKRCLLHDGVVLGQLCQSEDVIQKESFHNSRWIPTGRPRGIPERPPGLQRQNASCMSFFFYALLFRRNSA